MSTKENTITKDELDLSTSTISNASLSTTIGPGQHATFYVLAGRNYLMSITDIDDSFEATVVVVDGNGPPKRATIQPDRLVAIPVNGDSGMVTVYNTSNAQASNRPKIFVSNYSA